jgi:hypothetical protein
LEKIGLTVRTAGFLITAGKKADDVLKQKFYYLEKLSAGEQPVGHRLNKS